MVKEATPRIMALIYAIGSGDMVTAKVEALKLVKILEKIPTCFENETLGECPFVCVYKHAKCLRKQFWKYAIIGRHGEDYREKANKIIWCHEKDIRWHEEMLNN